jgi:hypothetical protein
MSFTNNEISRMCEFFIFLGNMLPIERLAQSFGTTELEIEELTRKCETFLRQDPRKPTTEIYGRVANVIKDHAEDFLNDDGVDPKIADLLAERVILEIMMSFELVDHETMKRFRKIVTQKEEAQWSAEQHLEPEEKWESDQLENE